MKKVFYILLVIIVLILILIAFLYIANNRKIEEEAITKFELIYRPKNNKDINLILGKNETNIYSYGGEVEIKLNDEEILSLKEALLSNRVTMEQIIGKAENDFDKTFLEFRTYSDGGTREYPYPEYAIIKYNNLDGNRDVYIGPKGMTLRDLK